MTTSIRFTRMETVIVNLLEDGKPHRTPDIITALGDNLISRASIVTCISGLKRKLEPIGETIIHVSRGRYHLGYQRLILYPLRPTHPLHPSQKNPTVLETSV